MISTEELELDIGNIFMTVWIEYEIFPGEPEVRYDSNGTGYPGSPPSIEIIDVEVTSVSGETYDLSAVELENGGWDKDLARIAEYHIETNSGIIEDLMEWVE